MTSGSRNRTLSGRRRSSVNTGRHRFSIGTFRGLQHPQLSKKMNRVIKSENSAIAAHESAARQRMSIAAQISEWGETTEDEAISDISDKLGVLMAEMGEQEDVYAQHLEDYRSVLKHIRDTESSVQPTRDQRAKIADDIQRLKLKEPNSHKIETMEQELVRAEAQNLVAEAQLTNVTRQRFKEAYSVHLAAVIERGEKQALLARHARRLLNCLDDTSVIPGDEPKPYERGNDAKQIVEDAERELQSWETDYEHVEIKADHGAAAVPMSTSLPSSHEERGHRASQSQATESLEEQQEEYTQADATSVSDTYSRISANDAASPTRIHSISAPRMYAGAFETAPVVNREESVRKENDRIGGEMKLKTLAPHDTQGIMSPGSDVDFPIRTKQSELGSPLDSQVQRVAVPI
ncbi:Eisosome component PIL1-domain-containing protein [Aspergillus foveolatus]|uniref:Eisosome component PIL1-domain-containing protein n=1 Tax=Aspergillus foveolatus TaxID=210207 RepID=UPI003CCC96F0